MNITIIGVGYVGLVTGACLAQAGHCVVCLDSDPEKIALLRSGGVSIYEPQLQEYLHRNTSAGRLSFTSNVKAAVAHGDVQFITVDTPLRRDGSADVSNVEQVARHIGRYLTRYALIVGKSTVPVGTAARVRAWIQQELDNREATFDFSVAANPEFLKEGEAINDCMTPDRVVIGTEDLVGAVLLKEIYAHVQQEDRLMFMDVRSAELAKYACNAMLATRVSFMNEMAALADEVGASIEEVRRCMAADPRIGDRFLHAGLGYGGSCFPKDVTALIEMGRRSATRMQLLESVRHINDRQQARVASLFERRFGLTLDATSIAIWGLSFKPDTDDVREAPSLGIIQALRKKGAHVRLYDPVALGKARKIFADAEGVTFSEDMYQALQGADGLVVATEWSIFRHPDFARMRRAMRQAFVVDGRNLFAARQRELRAAGIRCVGVGLAALDETSARLDWNASFHAPHQPSALRSSLLQR